MSHERDPFLSESWEQHAEIERGETRQEKAGRVYELIKENVQEDEQLKGSFEEVRSWMQKYVGSIDGMAALKLTSRGTKELEASDHNRRLAHNALIDSINALSRAFRDKGLDNNWRRAIGSDRNEIARWAVNAAEYVTRKELPVRE